MYVCKMKYISVCLSGWDKTNKTPVFANKIDGKGATNGI